MGCLISARYGYRANVSITPIDRSGSHGRGRHPPVLWYYARRVGRGVRVAEGARLESVYRATYRGFESLPLRHFMVALTVPPQR